MIDEQQESFIMGVVVLVCGDEWGLQIYHRREKIVICCVKTFYRERSFKEKFKSIIRRGGADQYQSGDLQWKILDMLQW